MNSFCNSGLSTLTKSHFKEYEIKIYSKGKKNTFYNHVTHKVKPRKDRYDSFQCLTQSHTNMHLTISQSATAMCDSSTILLSPSLETKQTKKTLKENKEKIMLKIHWSEPER